MRDLVERMRAALDETERIARAAAKETNSPNWNPGQELGESMWADGTGGNGYFVTGPWGTELPWELRQYIAAHDPSHALALVQAHREILEWCEEVVGDRDLANYDTFGALKDDRAALAITLAVETVRLLARAYEIEP